jgi:hypothetical protein
MTTRKTFDPDDETVLPPHGHMPGERLPCRWCGTPTLRATLAQYGARCFGCYEVFCQAPQPPFRFVGDKREGPQAWAWALKAAEERDPSSVSRSQRAAWRSALASELSRQRTLDEERAS